MKCTKSKVAIVIIYETMGKNGSIFFGGKSVNELAKYKREPDDYSESEREMFRRYEYRREKREEKWKAPLQRLQRGGFKM